VSFGFVATWNSVPQDPVRKIIRAPCGAERKCGWAGMYRPSIALGEGWFHPWAAGAGAWCPAVSRPKEQGEGVLRAEGLEPSRAVKLNGFSYRLRLSPPGRGILERTRQVCGLDYPFTVSRKIRGLGAARLVSTPSRLERPPGLVRDRHFRFPRI